MAVDSALCGPAYDRRKPDQDRSKGFARGDRLRLVRRQGAYGNRPPDSNLLPRRVRLRGGLPLAGGHRATARPRGERPFPGAPGAAARRADLGRRVDRDRLPPDPGRERLPHVARRGARLPDRTAPRVRHWLLARLRRLLRSRFRISSTRHPTWPTRSRIRLRSRRSGGAGRLADTEPAEPARVRRLRGARHARPSAVRRAHAGLSRDRGRARSPRDAADAQAAARDLRSRSSRQPSHSALGRCSATTPRWPTSTSAAAS